MVKLPMLEKFFMPLVFVLFSGFCNHDANASTSLPHVPTTKWVSVESIKESIKNTKPMNVGFDIDDTLLFTAPVFFNTMEKLCPDAITADDKNDVYKCLGTTKFWDYANTHDEYDIPKNIARRLIAMHVARGDNIYFITMRAKATNTKETLTQVLKKDFNLKTVNPVIFLGDLKIDPTKKAPKAHTIKELGVKIYYGDSDSDIESAQVAHARGIRVMRAANSYEQPLPLNGDKGEEVIVDSDV